MSGVEGEVQMLTWHTWSDGVEVRKQSTMPSDVASLEAALMRSAVHLAYICLGSCILKAVARRLSSSASPCRSLSLSSG